MPPRVIVGLVVIFWLASFAWLLNREWWQWIRAESPPPFSVELIDEATVLEANWSILRFDDQKIGSQKTTMICQKDDTFEMRSSIDEFKFELPVGQLQLHIPRLVTVQRVARDGKLVSIKSSLILNVNVFGQTFNLNARLDGRVKDGKLHARVGIKIPSFDEATTDIEPIALESASLFNPLQPLARLHVQPGQKWKITNFDLLGQLLQMALPQLLGQILGKGAEKNAFAKIPLAAPKTILAEVLTDRQNLNYQERTVSCRVIQFRGDDLTGVIWVDAADGKVLRQEASVFGIKMVLLREY